MSKFRGFWFTIVLRQKPKGVRGFCLRVIRLNKDIIPKIIL